MDEDQALAAAPAPYKEPTAKERLVLEYARNFEKQFFELYPTRSRHFALPKDPNGYERFVVTFVRPTLLPYPQLLSLEGIVNFVSDSLDPHTVDDPTSFPETLSPPSQALAAQEGNPFDAAVLLVSLLLGAGFDALALVGYADRQLTECDQSRLPCPSRFLTHTAAIAGLCEEAQHPVYPQSTTTSAPETKENPFLPLHEPPVKDSEFIRRRLLREKRVARGENRAAVEGGDVRAAGYLADGPDAEADAALADLSTLPEALRAPCPVTAPEDDELYGRRVHCWVAVRPTGPRSAEAPVLAAMPPGQPLFIDPLAGRLLPASAPVFHGVEAAFDADNFYVCLQDCSRGVKNLNWDVSGAGWEPILIADPLLAAEGRARLSQAPILATHAVGAATSARDTASASGRRPGRRPSIAGSSTEPPMASGAGVDADAPLLDLPPPFPVRVSLSATRARGRFPVRPVLVEKVVAPPVAVKDKPAQAFLTGQSSQPLFPSMLAIESPCCVSGAPPATEEVLLPQMVRRFSDAWVTQTGEGCHETAGCVLRVETRPSHATRDVLDADGDYVRTDRIGIVRWEIIEHFSLRADHLQLRITAMNAEAPSIAHLQDMGVLPPSFTGEIPDALLPTPIGYYEEARPVAISEYFSLTAANPRPDALWRIEEVPGVSRTLYFRAARRPDNLAKYRIVFHASIRQIVGGRHRDDDTLAAALSACAEFEGHELWHVDQSKLSPDQSPEERRLADLADPAAAAVQSEHASFCIPAEDRLLPSLSSHQAAVTGTAGSLHARFLSARSVWLTLTHTAGSQSLPLIRSPGRFGSAQGPRMYALRVVDHFSSLHPSNYHRVAFLTSRGTMRVSEHCRPGVLVPEVRLFSKETGIGTILGAPSSAAKPTNGAVADERRRALTAEFATLGALEKAALQSARDTATSVNEALTALLSARRPQHLVDEAQPDVLAAVRLISPPPHVDEFSLLAAHAAARTLAPASGAARSVHRTATVPTGDAGFDPARAKEDYLYLFLPAEYDHTKQPPLNTEEAAAVRTACLSSLRERLIERANLMQRRLDEQNAELARHQASFQRAADQMDSGEEIEFARVFQDGMFRARVLQKRLQAHEVAALERYAALDRQIRSDPRMSNLTAALGTKVKGTPAGPTRGTLRRKN
jgi:hypothetical protein